MNNNVDYKSADEQAHIHINFQKCCLMIRMKDIEIGMMCVRILQI